VLRQLKCKLDIRQKSRIRSGVAVCQDRDTFDCEFCVCISEIKVFPTRKLYVLIE